MQRAIGLLDNVYQKKVKNGGVKTEGDLGNVAARLYGEPLAIKVRYNGEYRGFKITPSGLEAYLQLYNNDMAAFLKDYIPYCEISEIPENHRTKKQKSRMKRLEKKLGYQKGFDSAHMYMLERRKFTQQDIDYAINLADKEQRTEEIADSYFEGRTAGVIYQQVIFQRIFDGISRTMHQISTQDKKADGISLETYNQLQAGSTDGTDGAIEWLDRYFVKCIKAGPELGFWGFALVLDESDEGYKEALQAGVGVAAASVLVIQPEMHGDLNIVSIFTYPPFRRRGYGSRLLQEVPVKKSGAPQL